MRLRLPNLAAIEASHPRPSRASALALDELLSARLVAWYSDLRDRAGLDAYPAVQNVRVCEAEDRRLREWLERLYKRRSRRWLSRRLGMFWLNYSPAIDDTVPEGWCDVRLPGDEGYVEPPGR